MTEIIDPVAAAATMIAALAERRAEVLNRKTRMIEEIAGLAYAAIVENDKSAQARTTELSAVVGQIDLEIVALNAAESEARRRQTAAKTAAERAAVLVKVEKASDITAGAWRACFRRCWLHTTR